MSKRSQSSASNETNAKVQKTAANASASETSKDDPNQKGNFIIPDIYVEPEKNPADWAALNLNLNGWSNIDVVKWKIFSSGTINKISGKNKSTPDVFDATQKLYIKESGSASNKLPADYSFFGNEDSVNDLTQFLRTNPFLASALIGHQDGANLAFELDSTPIDATTPLPADSNWFKRFTNQLNNDGYVRVKARFAADLTLTYIETFSTSKGVLKTLFRTDYPASANPAQLQDAAAWAMFLLVYYAEVLHTTVHCFHYMMDAAICGATHSSSAQTTFFRPYLPNVAIKYFEVETLLLNHTGAIAKSIYNSNYQNVMQLIRELFCSWNHCHTAAEFVQNFLLKDVYGNGLSDLQVRENGILAAFFKQTDLIPAYVTELVTEFGKEQSGKALASTNKELSNFFQLLNVPGYPTVSTMTNMNDWLHLMSVTGIMHGATLSFSRWFCTAPNMSRLVPSTTKYSDIETNAITLVTLTMMGMIDEHHVFTDQLQHNLFHPLPKNVQSVLHKYEALTSDLKREYYMELQRDAANFKKNGWIISDYCPDGVDGKQLTLTTYF